MTKREYVKIHPRTHLTKNLICVNWPDDTEIDVIGGQIAPHTKQSNLYTALQKSVLHEYVVGGHRHYQTEGYRIAVA